MTDSVSTSVVSVAPDIARISPELALVDPELAQRLRCHMPAKRVRHRPPLPILRLSETTERGIDAATGHPAP